ncbi:MAG: hypothetical protein IKR74_03705 [Bacilli bacterium]|nr:hypothetical protein [Bacilli bacterium]
MEKINTEMVVSSLFLVGFDQVDTLLYTCVLGQLSIDNQEMQLFEFSDIELSAVFNKYVNYNGIIFKLKEGVSLETNVSPIEGKVLPLGKVLHTSKKLIDYLTKLDFRKIVLKKISILCNEDIDNLDLLFSSKEKAIIHEMFGLSKIPHKSDDISSLDSFEVFKRMIESYNNNMLNENDDKLGRKKQGMCIRERKKDDE